MHMNVQLRAICVCTQSFTRINDRVPRFENTTRRLRSPLCVRRPSRSVGVPRRRVVVPATTRSRRRDMDPREAAAAAAAVISVARVRRSPRIYVHFDRNRNASSSRSTDGRCDPSVERNSDTAASCRIRLRTPL